MFALKQDTLLLSLKPFGTFQLLPTMRERFVWDNVNRQLAGELLNRAFRALDVPLPVMPASTYAQYQQTGNGPWLDAYILSRERLKSLTLGACIQGSTQFLTAIADQLYAICESSAWSTKRNGGGYPDPEMTVIDLSACETGSLLATSVYLLEDYLNTLSPCIATFVHKQIAQRLMSPIIHQTMDICDIPLQDIPQACSALMTITMLTEKDDQRRWLELRGILRMLETYLQKRFPDGSFTHGLKQHLTEAMALNDIFSMLSVASGGEVELRDENLFVAIANSFVCSHITGKWFVNPGGTDMQPDLSPDQLFSLGSNACSSALCALAAYLKRQDSSITVQIPVTTRTPPLFEQVMTSLNRTRLLEYNAYLPQHETTTLHAMHMLCGRMGSFFVSLTGPANSTSCPGAINLFFNNKPVILTMESVTGVPLINKLPPQQGAGAKDSDIRTGPAWNILTLSMGAVYPKESRVSSWTRSWLVSLTSGAVRLLDIYELESTARIDFQFLLYVRPRILDEGHISLNNGLLSLAYDTALKAEITEVPVPEAQRVSYGETLYLLTFTSLSINGNAKFAFDFSVTDNTRNG